MKIARTSQTTPNPFIFQSQGVVIPGQGEAKGYEAIELLSVALQYTTNAEAGVRTAEVGIFRTEKPTESMLFDSVDIEEVSKGFYFQWVTNGGTAPYEGGATSIGQPNAKFRPLPSGIIVPEGWTAGITVEGKKGTDVYLPRILWRGKG